MKRFGLGLLILLCFPGFLRAQDIGGRALLTYQETHSEDVNTRDFTQNYELRLKKSVTPAFEYRFFIRWQDTMGKIEEEGRPEQRNRGQFLQPSVDFLFNFEPFEFRTGYEFTRTKNRPTPGDDTIQEQKRFFNRLTWRPEGLPSISIQFDRKTNQDRRALDTIDTDLNTTADYGYKALKLFYNFRFNQFEDKSIHFTRKNFDNLGSVGYQDNFLGNRLNITANYNVNFRKGIELAEAGGLTTLPVERLPRKGLFVNDDSPLNNTDHPMVETPSLIDRNLTASTGINIGTPGGISSQNIGVDLGRAFEVSQIHIHVRNSTGGLVPLGGPITWNIYNSSNGVDWPLIVAGATFLFNQTFSRYEINLPSPVTAQFFKVVNLGVNIVDTLVTEIQTFGSDTFEAGEERAQTTFLQTGNLTTMWKPVEKVTLTYDGFFSKLRDKPENKPTFTTTDWNQGITALLEPFRFLAANLRYQKRKSKPSEGQEQSSDFYSAVFDLRFLQTLTSSFSVSQTSDRIDGEKSVTTSAFLLHNAAKLYKEWDVNLDLTYTRSKNFTESQETDSYGISATSFTRLTKNLTWLSNATSQISTVSNPTKQKTRTSQVNTEFFYRPSQQLSLSARWGYLHGEEQSGLVQRYRIDWLPFPEGAIQFTGAYSLDRDQTADQSQSRLSGIVRWNINRHAYLDFNYTRTVQKTVNDTTEVQTFFTTFNITF